MREFTHSIVARENNEAVWRSFVRLSSKAAQKLSMRARDEVVRKGPYYLDEFYARRIRIHEAHEKRCDALNREFFPDRATAASGHGERR